ncbi:hypothetical protein HID58_069756 [Brassica napus]|uniref:Uncharacterized protein n=1 Tax=Brassica napus TaxID=3708 RepID=A0ABQ7YWS7_BRANA|nr:hypothetical protein HID58_069756 [Brassica napus]
MQESGFTLVTLVQLQFTLVHGRKRKGKKRISLPGLLSFRECRLWCSAQMRRPTRRLCAGVPDKSDKFKQLDVTEWLTAALGPLKGRCGKGRSGLASGDDLLMYLSPIVNLLKALHWDQRKNSVLSGASPVTSNAPPGQPIPNKNNGSPRSNGNNNLYHEPILDPQLQLPNLSTIRFNY